MELGGAAPVRGGAGTGRPRPGRPSPRWVRGRAQVARPAWSLAPRPRGEKDAGGAWRGRS